MRVNNWTRSPPAGDALDLEWPEDAEKNITRIKREFHELADQFVQIQIYRDIDDIDDINAAIEAAEKFAAEMGYLANDMEECHRFLRGLPDPNAEWDNRGI